MAIDAIHVLMASVITKKMGAHVEAAPMCEALIKGFGCPSFVARS
jgi:hypothetical protein